jgi:protein-disulfide isomerase
MSELKVPVTSSDHIEGDEKASITLLEYGDYECPHCGTAYPIVKRVQKHFGKQLRFVFRNFPLVQAHPHAQSAAEAAEFAAAHGKFWEMHDAIYENQRRLNTEVLLELAEGLGLPRQDLAKALKSQQYGDKVRADFMGGVRSGVNGTPTFFINNYRHDGPFDYEDLIAGIKEIAG